jgi:tRNA-specific 2-thiouridylase
MIEIVIEPQSHTNHKTVKAVGLISGGLDSTLAAKIVKDLGVEVYGVYFSMPWGCCDKTKAYEAAIALGISFITLQLDERYLDVVKNPKHGYGSALNPCVDCRIHMFTRAAHYMREIGADFVFTGEVLGQRQMSQLKNSMRWIEQGSGLEGRLLRPLCAQLLPPTLAEQQGLIDREKLLALNGRSRKPQIELANQYEIKDFPQPAGGCLLTSPEFASRMKDTFKYGYRNFRETIALKWGRHFRINDQFKIILGRDEEENESLVRYAHPDDYILQMTATYGPIGILKGYNPPEDILKLAAGFMQKFSKSKTQTSIRVKYWNVKNRNDVFEIESVMPDEKALEEMKI